MGREESGLRKTQFGREKFPTARERNAEIMIYSFADDHYGARPGAMLNGVLPARYEIAFHENDLSALGAAAFAKECDLLILNLIAGTGATAPAGPAAEENLREYLARGGSMLLLHGASAAFWPWEWWRRIVGYRWVRGDDPDGVEPSTHPTRPYRVEVSKSRHPLCQKLRGMEFPEDEIYIRLEQTCPAMALMETTTLEGTFPQCWENATPWGGRVIGFLPGHRKEVAQDPALVRNVSHLIDSLLGAD